MCLAYHTKEYMWIFAKLTVLLPYPRQSWRFIWGFVYVNSIKLIVKTKSSILQQFVKYFLDNLGLLPILLPYMHF